MLELTQAFGIGAQFGGKYFCHDVRVVRLPRHGASLPGRRSRSPARPTGRRAAKITAEGVFLEQLETRPGALPAGDHRRAPVRRRRAHRPRTGRWTRSAPSCPRYPVKTRLSLTGPLVVARDIAHAKIKERLDAGEPMPAYLRDMAVYYAGPGEDAGGLRVRLVRPDHGRPDGLLRRPVPGGRRLAGDAGQGQPVARRSPRPAPTHGGFYLGSIGGPAARLAQDCIRKVEVLEYAELGMEAVWRIEVEDFPAFIVVDDKGNDFFAEVSRPVALTIGSRPDCTVAGPHRADQRRKDGRVEETPRASSPSCRPSSTAASRPPATTCARSSARTAGLSARQVAAYLQGVQHIAVGDRHRDRPAARGAGRRRLLARPPALQHRASVGARPAPGRTPDGERRARRRRPRSASGRTARPSWCTPVTRVFDAFEELWREVYGGQAASDWAPDPVYARVVADRFFAYAFRAADLPDEPTSTRRARARRARHDGRGRGARHGAVRRADPARRRQLPGQRRARATRARARAGPDQGRPPPRPTRGWACCHADVAEAIATAAARGGRGQRTTTSSRSTCSRPARARRPT